MYNGGDPFWLAALGPANELGSTRRSGHHETGTHCLLPSLCTRQLSWRSRSNTELKDVGSWLGGTRKGDEKQGGGGKSARVWESGLTLRGSACGRVELSRSPWSLYVSVCSLLSFRQ